MKQSLLFFFVAVTCIAAHAQNTNIQRLWQQLASHPQQDTFRVNRLNKLASSYTLSTARRDSAAAAALILAKQLGYTGGEIEALRAQSVTADKTRGKALLQQGLAIAERSGDKLLIAKASTQLGLFLNGTEEKKLALQYF